MRYKFATAAAVGVVVAALVGCSSSSAEPPATAVEGNDLVAAAQEEGVVTMYTGWQQPTIDAVQEAFKAEYGITVEIGDRLSSAALAQRIDADVRSTGIVGADVVLTTDQALASYLGDEGHSVELDSADYEGLDPDYVQDFAVTCAVGPPVVAWNTEVMGDDFEITEWDDLLDPAIGPQIMVSDPRGSAAWANTWSVIYNSDELGPDFIEQIGASGYQPVASSLVALEQLVAGQGGVQMFGPVSIFDTAIAQGQPIEYWMPEDPSPVYFNLCVQAAGTEHPNAGKLFLQWLMSVEGQNVFNTLEVNASPLGDAADTGVPLPASIVSAPAPFKVQQDQPMILEGLGFN